VLNFIFIISTQGYFGNVKWSHVAVLLMMTGGAMIPFIMMAADFVGPRITSAVNRVSCGAKHHSLVFTVTVSVFSFYLSLSPSSALQVIPSLQPLLVGTGLASAPKNRLNKFYEKHNPTKVPMLA
jgi:hypothetical protein